MKILVVSNLYPPDVIGGYEISCEQMVDELRDRGHDVVVLTAATRYTVGADPDHVRRVFDLHGHYDSPMQLRSRVGLRHAHATAHFVEPFNLEQFLRAFRDFEPDIVHLWNLVGLGGLGMPAALDVMSVPWVWHLGDCIPRALCALDSEISAPLAHLASRRFTGTFTACSRHIVEETERDGPRLARVEIVPNWVAGPAPEPRQSWRPTGTLRVVSAGQLAPAKGTDIAIEAVARYIEAGGDATLDVYGSGADGWVEAMILERNCGGRIRFLGGLPQTQLVARFADYDAFLFPTWAREPFAVVQLEAASRGCVPIITDDSGNAEWMVDGVHCVKARRNPDAFAAALHDVATRPDAPEIGRRAQAVVWRDFNIARSADQIEQILSEHARPVVPSPAQLDIAFAMARQAARLMHHLIDESALRANN